MPLSSDPNKQARQRANLIPGQGAAKRGNSLTRKHGAYARVTEAELEAKALELFDAIAADAPVRAADGGLPAYDGLVVRLLAEVMVRRERVRVTEEERGLEMPNGRLRGVVEYGLRLDDQALNLAKELGMTPLSRAKLGLDLARTHRTTLEDFIEGTEAS